MPREDHCVYCGATCLPGRDFQRTLGWAKHRTEGGLHAAGLHGQTVTSGSRREAIANPNGGAGRVKLIRQAFEERATDEGTDVTVVIAA